MHSTNLKLTLSFKLLS